MGGGDVVLGLSRGSLGLGRGEARGESPRMPAGWAVDGGEID